jgi:hypothetical protein
MCYNDRWESAIGRPNDIGGIGGIKTTCLGLIYFNYFFKSLKFADWCGGSLQSGGMLCAITGMR